MKEYNLTFKGGEPKWGNACVGDNGSPDYLTYAKGYSRSANILIETVLKSRSNVDVMIYPICFNMRHSVELRLKGLIDDLKIFEKFDRKLPPFELNTTHDLGNIWKFIKKEVITLDKRFDKFFKELDSYIVDISNIDSTGQVFRYPMSNENNKHLVEIGIISIPVLYNRFKELEKILDKLDYFKDDIIEEYYCKTYTKKLSRLDIYNIAKMLPIRDKWSNKNFKFIKEQIKQEFVISERELSKAIKIIENNYEFSKLINISKKLKYTTLDDLILFFDVWFKINEEEFEMHSVFSSDKDKMSKFLRQAVKINFIFDKYWEEKLKYIKKESFIEIRTLYYFYDLENIYSEQYESILKKDIDEKLHSYKEEFDELLGKSLAIEAILFSLNFLEQKDIYDELIKRYDSEIKKLGYKIEDTNYRQKNLYLGYK